MTAKRIFVIEMATPSHPDNWQPTNQVSVEKDKAQDKLAQACSSCPDDLFRLRTYYAIPKQEYAEMRRDRWGKANEGKESM